MPGRVTGSTARFNVDPPTRAVVEFAIQDPHAFMRGLARKVWYVLGWFDALLPGTGRSVFLIACWMTAAVGVLLVGVGRVPHDGTVAARVVPLTAAGMQAAAVIAVSIWRRRSDALVSRVDRRHRRSDLRRGVAACALAERAWSDWLGARFGITRTGS